MTSIELNDAISQIDSKMQFELQNNHPYEALQYMQSYIARKKKLLGQNTTSLLVFYGANKLVSSNASSTAGILLKWYIEDGAGSDYSFKLCTTNDTANYCDIQRVIDLVDSFTSNESFPIIDIIYAPLHLLIVNRQKKDPLTKCLPILKKFEELAAKIFSDGGKFYNSFKSYIRLANYGEAANVLTKWSNTGYTSEQPLFFGRALLYLLSEGKIEAAVSLQKIASTKIIDNISIESKSESGGSDSTSFAVWHLGTIVTELASMPVMPRVDKTKLFGLIYQMYGTFLSHLDTKLVDLLSKTGEVIFNYNIPNSNNNSNNNNSNPMALLQGLLGGGNNNNSIITSNGSNKNNNAAPSYDMNKMIDMMNKMQNAK